MTQPAGWYDDPKDPSQLRYWDGVVWSSHVSPRVSPTLEQSTIGMPYGVIPASARPQTPGSQGAQGASTTQRGYDSPAQGQAPSDGQWPAYGRAGSTTATSTHGGAGAKIWPPRAPRGRRRSLRSRRGASTSTPSPPFS